MASATPIATDAPQHLLGLVCIDHHRNHHVASGAQLGQAGACDPALGGKGLGRLGTHVIDVGRKSGPAQTAGHARAHGAKADQTDFFHVLSPSPCVNTVNTPV
jgi:hypothetical protein